VVEAALQPADRSLRRPGRLAKALARRVLVPLLGRRDLLLVKRRPFDPGLRAEGRDAPCFGYTMIGLRRLANIRHCVEDVLARSVPGDLAEAGVWRGGAAIFMRALLAVHGVTDRTVWVADSFRGLPAPASPQDGDDFSQHAYLRADRRQVMANFQRFGLLDGQVRFLEGWFKDTLPTAPIERLAVLRLDGDLYSSTLETLRSLYDRVSPGGYVIVDDYHAYEYCRRAVTDFLRERGLAPALTTIDWAGVYWQVPGP